MRTIIHKREYKTLISFLIFISIFLLIRQYFSNSMSILEDKYASIFSSNLNLTTTELIPLAQPLLDKIRDNEFNFGLIIIGFSILICVFLFFTLKSKNDKILLFIIPFLLFIIIENAHGIEINVKKDDEYCISLLIFLPFLFFIYKETIAGEKIDITEDIKSKAHINHEDNLKDLNKLLEMKLISQEEYDNKKESRTKERIRIEIKDTEEYNLLFKSKQKGLLTEQEFNIKIESLVSKKLQNS